MSLDLTSNDPQINFKMRVVNCERTYKFEDFTLYGESLLLFRGDEQLSLTPKVVETLLALVEHRGDVLSKDQLMTIVWPDSIVEESNLSQNLYLLRKTLGKTVDDKPFIETLRRRGYRFNGKVVNPSIEETHAHAVADETSDQGVFSEQGNDVHLHGLNVEKHGNVLALADWKPGESSSKAEFKTSPVKAESVDLKQKRKPRLYLFTTVVIATLIFFFSVIGWRSLSSMASEQEVRDMTIEKLTDGENLDAAAISRDGNYFTYVTHDGEKNHLWLQQAGSATRVEITPAFPGSVRGTTFTPDSRSIYFVVNERDGDQNVLYRVPTLGGPKSRIDLDVDTPVSFSPDGSQMTFLRASKESKSVSLMIAESDGTDEKMLTTKAAEEASMNGTGEWSPDGKTIAWGLIEMKKIGQGGCTVVGTDVESGTTRPLSSERWDNCFRMGWTRDSRGLVMIGTRANEAYSTRRDQVYYVRLDDGRSRRLTADGSRYQYASLSVTEKNEVFAVAFNRISQVWSIGESGDAATAQQITTGQADGRGGIVPLSDARVAYLTRSGDGFSIWMMNSDGSGRKQLIDGLGSVEELRAPADGSFFVFSAKREGNNHLYRIDADGEQMRQLTFGDSHEVDSTISPDGTWIVYESKVYSGDYGKTSIWKIPSEGGDPVFVSDIDCMTPHFSPDGTQISCVSPDWKHINILSSVSGKLISTFRSRENSILNVGARWTRDGRSLAYICNQNNTSNIFLQPVEGGDPRRLTDFTSGEIYNFTASLNKPTLFLARGYPVRNAILIRNF